MGVEKRHPSWFWRGGAGGRRPRRGTRLLAFAAVEVLLLAGVGVAVARLSASTVTVVVDGRPATMPGRRPTVADAMRHAHVKATTADIRSVQTGRIVGHQPPRLTINGRPATRSTV